MSTGNALWETRYQTTTAEELQRIAASLPHITEANFNIVVDAMNTRYANSALFSPSLTHLNLFLNTDDTIDYSKLQPPPSSLLSSSFIRLTSLTHLEFRLYALTILSDIVDHQPSLYPFSVAIGEFVRTSKSLQRLDVDIIEMSGEPNTNDVVVDHVMAILKECRHSSSLTSLKLNTPSYAYVGNTIESDHESDEITSIVRSSSSITHLQIRGHGIQFPNLLAIFAAIGASATMRHFAIDIWWTLSNEEYIQIMNHVVPSQLEFIGIQRFDVTDERGIALATIASTHPTLRHIDMTSKHTRLSDLGAKKMLELMQMRSGIFDIDVSIIKHRNQQTSTIDEIKEAVRSRQLETNAKQNEQLH